MVGSWEPQLLPPPRRVSPVVPAFGVDDAFEEAVGVDHPGIHSPCSTQVENPRAGESAVEEGEPGVLFERAPLRGRDCAIACGDPAECATLDRNMGLGEHRR